MSESEQSGAGRREVAYRLFATEFEDADFSYSESDEERAPNYVITPTGARVNRLFVVGVLTEVEQVSEDVLRARVVDPTGAFVLYAGQYQPDEQAFLDGARTPMFVAVTGKARTFQPDDSDQVFTSVRPESISEVDAETRDRWTVQTAEQTIERVGHMATALSLDVRGDDLRATLEDNGVDDGLAAGIPLAIEHYGTTGAYLSALRNLSLDAARLVAGELDEVEGLSLSPDQGDDADLPELADADVEASVSAQDVSDAAIEANASRASTDAGASEPADTAEADTAETTSTESVETDSQTTTSVVADDTADAETATETTASASTEPTADTSTEPTIDTTAEQATDTTAETGTDAETTSADAVETSTSESETESPPSQKTGTESAETDTVEAAAATPGGAEGDVSEPSQSGSTTQSTATGDTGAESATDEDIGDFEPGEFELDEDEREEIEEEYGTEFQSGTDVPEPGESDIETPDPEEPPEDGAMEATESTEESEPTETSDAEPVAADASEEQVEETEAAEDIDLEDVTVDVMAELDEGDGANRETLIETVVDRYGVDPDDVEDAIQDALMDGRCYEPDDTTVKPI